MEKKKFVFPCGLGTRLPHPLAEVEDCSEGESQRAAAAETATEQAAQVEGDGLLKYAVHPRHRAVVLFWCDLRRVGQCNMIQSCTSLARHCGLQSIHCIVAVITRVVQIKSILRNALSCPNSWSAQAEHNIYVYYTLYRPCLLPSHKQQLMAWYTTSRNGAQEKKFHQYNITYVGLEVKVHNHKRPVHTESEC